MRARDISSRELPRSTLLLHLYSSSAGVHALLLRVSCSTLLVAPVPELLMYLEPALLLGFSLVVMGLTRPYVKAGCA